LPSSAWGSPPPTDKTTASQGLGERRRFAAAAVIIALLVFGAGSVVLYKWVANDRNTAAEQKDTNSKAGDVDHSSPETVANAFFTALMQHDRQKARACYSADDLPRFDRDWDDELGRIPIHEFHVLNTEMKGTAKAKVRVRVRATNPETKKVEYEEWGLDCKKVDERWYVCEKF
jgi:hypothetical protein